MLLACSLHTILAPTQGPTILWQREEDGDRNGMYWPKLIMAWGNRKELVYVEGTLLGGAWPYHTNNTTHTSYLSWNGGRRR